MAVYYMYFQILNYFDAKNMYRRQSRNAIYFPLNKLPL